MKKAILASFSGVIISASFFIIGTGPFSVPVAHADTTSGLNMYLKFDEGSGVMPVDSVGTNYALEDGAPTYVPGKVGPYGLNFGSGDQVTLHNSLNYTAGSPFTVSVWAKPTTTEAGYTRLLETSYATAFYLGLNSTGTKYDFIVNSSAGGGTEPCTGGTITVGQWTLVTATYDGTNSRLYVNGNLVCTFTPSAAPTSLGIMGVSSKQSQFSWHGIMDDVRYYTRALSASDVSELYSGSAPAISSVSVSTTTTTATISWLTDQSASSTVNYGLTSSYGFASTSDVMSTSHSVTLSGLNSSTLYHFQIASGNSSSLVATSSDNTFVTQAIDTTPPVISGIASTTSSTSATIAWNTDEPSDSTILYGTASGVYASSSSATALTTSHSLSLPNLTVSTTYYFVVASTDASGNAATSSEQTLTTPVSDTTPPSVPTGLSATAVSPTEIDLSWLASTDSNGIAGYQIYRNGSQISTTSSTAFADTGLSTSTQYSYTVSAFDAAFNLSAQSSPVSTTTLVTSGQPIYRTLTLYKYEHAGQGTVTASVNGAQIINCAASQMGTTVSACTAPVLVGSTITLTAIPAASSSLSRFEDCPNASGNTCTIAMPNWDMSLGAVFTSGGFTPKSSLADIINQATSSLTWVFTGDSFSTLQTYTVYFESYFELHYPNLTFHFRNAGRGGSVVGDLTDDPTINPHIDPITGSQVGFNVDSAFDRTVYGQSPDVVSVEFTDNGHPTPQQLHDAVKGFIQDYIIPNHSNPVVLGAWPTNNLADLASSTSYFKTLFDADEQVGQELNIPAGTDWYTMAPMMAANLASSTPINLDGFENDDNTEHLNEAGTLAATSYILADLGADSDVSSTTIDANSGTLVSADHATVTDVARNAYSGVDFTRKDDRLPMAFDDLSRPVLEIDPQVLDMNKYMLTVQNLAPGNYDIYIDGVKSATVDSNTLASGWNMTAMTQGPIHDQLLDVISKIRQKEGVSQTRLYGSVQMSDPTNPCVPSGFNWWGDTNYGSSAGWYNNPGYRGDVLVAKLAPARTELACLDDRIHAAAQPVARTFSIRATADTIAPTITNIAASTTDSSAVVTWTTDEAASSTVNFGLDSNYGNASTSDAFDTAHSIGLLGLAASTTYHFQVASADASGNIATSSDFIFTTSAAPDTTPPVISGVSASTTETDATVIWTTDEASDATISYGTTSGDYTLSTSSSALDTSHALDLANLTASTTYYYVIASTNDSGDTATSSEQNFTTGAAPDTTPPVISSIAASTTDSAATIAWNTDEISDSTVLYGTTSDAYTASTSLASLNLFHSLTLDGLSASTTYYYMVESTDASGNTATSSEQTFVTAAASDITPPVLSSIEATTTDSTATITWNTDEDASSTVNYGFDSSYGNASSSDEFATSHSITLTGLNASATYHFDVASADQSGNLATSSDFMFTTSQAPDVTPPVISAITASTSDSGALVTWNTDESSDSSLEYGTVSGVYTASTSVAALGTDHSIDLENLSASTTYYYVVESSDASGNAATSSEQTFVTAAAPDITPPVLSSIEATTTDSTATITWTTDENASSTVSYGLDANYGTASTSDLFETTHSIVLTGLNASTTYHFGVTSADQSGNLATSSDFMFTTIAAPDITPPVITAVSASTTDSAASVSWNTDESSDSSIEFGTTTGIYTASTSIAESVTSHSIDLANLSASTTYYYIVESTDASGNMATSSEQTFTTLAAPDTTAPVISLVASSTDETTATITWTTDEAASSTVEYGTDSSYGFASSSDGFGTSHSITLTGLSSGTLYHFRISSADASGNVATSSDLTFTTVTPAPQVINSIVATPSSNSATISWKTDGNNAPTPETHTITLTSLTPSTTYHFTIGYDSGTGTTATSTDVTFTTTQ